MNYLNLKKNIQILKYMNELFKSKNARLRSLLMKITYLKLWKNINSKL